jgi:hypothetical protein
MATDPEGPGELTSWKEIAAFLGVSERSAQNWEQKHGLPVKRLPGAKGRVLASTMELEEWKRKALVSKPGDRRLQNTNELEQWGKKSLVSKRGNEDARWFSGRRYLRGIAAVATLLVILGIALVAGSRFAANKTRHAASYDTDGRTFVAKDTEGLAVWRWTAPEPFLMPRYRNNSTLDRPAVWFGDLNGDSRTETILLYDPVNRIEVGCSLYCFSDEGDVMWTFTPGGSVTTPTATYSGPFIIANFLVADLDKDGVKEILVTSHQLSEYPNQFALLSNTGALKGEYWHSGFLSWIDYCDLDRDGIDEILLAQVNNGHKCATLVVLDPRQVRGASTQDDDPRYQIEGMERGKEKAVVLFPQSCISRLYAPPINSVSLLAVQGDTIRVEVRELQDDLACSIAYVFGRDLVLTRMPEISDRFKFVHRELRLSGKLDHDLSDQEIEKLKNGIRVIKYPQIQ